MTELNVVDVAIAAAPTVVEKLGLPERFAVALTEIFGWLKLPENSDLAAEIEAAQAQYEAKQQEIVVKLLARRGIKNVKLWLEGHS